jgi:chemotaxis protein MotB
MRRRQVQEESVNHERWLISYADFITLLMAFFVVMYSISQVNDGKYRVLSNTLTEAFNLPEQDLKPFQIGEIAKSNPLNIDDSQLGADTDRLADGEGGEHYGELKNTTLEELNGRLQALFPEQIQNGQIEIIGNESWLQIEVSSNLLFFSGSASMGYESQSIVNEIAGVLFDFENPVRVEGFTDNQPLNNDTFASNWELSSARSSAIVRQLVESGIRPSRLAAVGYGEYQPRASNDTAEGRALNRRVVFMVSRSENLRPALERLRSAASDSANNTRSPAQWSEDMRSLEAQNESSQASTPLQVAPLTKDRRPFDNEEAEVESLPLPESRTAVVAGKRQNFTATPGESANNKGLIQRSSAGRPPESATDIVSEGWQLESAERVEQTNTLPTESKAASVDVEQEDRPGAVLQAVDGVKTVKLKGGGLLFTSEENPPP